MLTAQVLGLAASSAGWVIVVVLPFLLVLALGVACVLDPARRRRPVTSCPTAQGASR